MRSLQTFWLFLCVLAPAATSGQAVDTPGQNPPSDLTQRSLEDLLAVEVVSSASRYDQRISEAPANVTIVTADEIARHGYRTLGELLQNVRGLYLSDDRNYQYLGVRGFDRPGDFNNRLLVMVDGHRVNDNVYGAVTLNTSFAIDLAIVDRVEIVRGPGSSLYGTNAVFAVINVVTRRATSRERLRVGGDFSDFATGRADVSYGKSFRRGQGLLVAFNAGQIGGGRFDEDTFSRFYAKAAYRNLSVHASYVSRERLLALPSFGPFADPRSRTLDSRGYVELEYERRYGPRSALTMKVSFDESEYRGQYAYVRRDGTEVPWAVMASGRGRWLSADVQRTRIFGARHHLTAGSELRWDIAQEVGSFGATSGADDRRSSVFAALFAQDEYRLARGAAIHAGLRYDHYGTFGGTTNPRIALVLQPSGRTSIKLLYGRAFRAPTAYELYRDRDRPTMPRVDLEPERIRTYEASLDQRLGPWFHTSVSSYDSQMRNVISLGTSGSRPGLIYQNREEARGRGVEVELTGQSPLGVKGSVSYAHQRARNERGAELTNSPRHLATARFTVPLVAHRLFVAGDTRYGSSRLALTGDRSQPAFVTDLTLTGLVKPRGLDLVLSVYNLFDGGVVDPFASMFVASTQQAGRTWRLGFRTAF